MREGHALRAGMTTQHRAGTALGRLKSYQVEGESRAGRRRAHRCQRYPALRVLGVPRPRPSGPTFAGTTGQSLDADVPGQGDAGSITAVWIDAMQVVAGEHQH